jgi:hypothetical protein
LFTHFVPESFQYFCNVIFQGFLKFKISNLVSNFWIFKDIP